MKAVVYEKPGRKNGVIKDIPMPHCGDDEVLMKVMACGICKAAEISHDRAGSLMGKYPATPGHEFAGVAVEVGKNVSHISVGDRITADNGYPCGTCYYCQKGMFTACENFRSQGHNLQGGFAQYVTCRGDKTYVIPDGVSFDSASLCELIGCALNAVDRAAVKYGDNVLIVGCGSSGSILAQLFKHTSAARVVAIDSVPSKLERISAAGVETVLVDRDNYDVHEARLKSMFPHGIDIIVDAAGDDKEMFERCVRLLAVGGRYVMYSFFYNEPKFVCIEPGLMIRRDLKIMGTTFQMFRMGESLDVLKNGVVDSSLVISKTYPIEKYFEAMDETIHDNEVMKIIIHPNDA